ncbi:MAG: roadblock/LC7 domain-containing protein [Planctomycetia bacterium]|jgi:predicted regulator of Ras-like GTPase activity (Roadblock/LC7/MglB family)|nr:roadblock/LC7 domain-containing protein [Planctomycetia bacterium]
MATDKSLRDTRLVFYKDDIESINAILDAFLKQSAAKCALLIDKDGHMVTSRGATKRIDLDTISALVAGSFAATREMARILGEEEFSALYHQGKSDNIQLSIVGDRALLTAIFDESTTVGMVRLYAAEAAKRLAAIFRKKAQEAVAAGSTAGEGDATFRTSTGSALDNLFGK